MLPQRKRTRLEGFDYSSDRLYFITCCVKHMRHCFGQVVDGRMRLNDYGVIADAQWLWLAEQYPYVKLHAHIIMHSMPGQIICTGFSRLIRSGRDLQR